MNTHTCPNSCANTASSSSALRRSRNPILDREPEWLTSIDRCFDGDDECDLRFDRNVDALRNPQLSSQAIDHELDPFDDERRRLAAGAAATERESVKRKNTQVDENATHESD